MPLVAEHTLGQRQSPSNLAKSCSLFLAELKHASGLRLSPGEVSALSPLQVHTAFNVLCVWKLIKHCKLLYHMGILHLYQIFVEGCWVAGYVDHIVKVL